MEKIKILLILLFIILSCNKQTMHDKIYKSINFEWALFELQYFDTKEKKSINMMEIEKFSIIGFEKYNHMWFNKRNVDTFIGADYHIFLEKDTLRFKISNSEDRRLNATYDMYIDTLYEEKGYHHIRLTLDSENVFIVAEKKKSKPRDFYK